MARIDEIAPQVFRIAVHETRLDMDYCHFLVRDEAPLLFHAGLRSMFSEVREAVSTLLDPATLRFIGFSHFESDECGALNDWLGIAPQAVPLCGLVGALTSVADFAIRAPHILAADKTLSTGAHSFRFLPTPHLPHGWDAGMLFEETRRTLFCSDLFSQKGERTSLIHADLVEQARPNLLRSRSGPFAHSTVYSSRTSGMLEELAQLAPRTLATMHGSSFSGDGGQELRSLATTMTEILGGEA